jgi:hypothetical protein
VKGDILLLYEFHKAKGILTLLDSLSSL